jgi:hypothetical protein
MVSDRREPQTGAKAMSINQRSADRLDKLAAEKGIHVRISESTKPKRRWYSIGNNHGWQWHQVAGFTEIEAVEKFIATFGNA